MSEPASHLEHQMTASLQRCCETGVFFNFRLPKTGYSLRKVTLGIDGVPKLVFDSANSIEQPTLTEEDVAVAARLAAEGTRPEFYYIPIPPGHPFHGRQYKEYKPKWLRGTSVGEVFAEADWKMKCLSIGTKTNANKTMFWAARETSRLEGQLGTTLDFPRSSEEAASIKMSCKSVKVKKTSSDLEFVGEPKMQIIHDANPSYTKYITEMYDSVAYYDEPLYLKMKELIKLFLGMEFLVKEKGVKFDSEWYVTASSRSAASQAIEVSEKDIPEVDFRKLPDHLPPAAKEEVKFMAKTKTGVQFQHNESPETTCAVSIKDYDLLYQGFNPKEPVSFDGSIVPDVDSWAELHAETVPWPRVWKFRFPAIMTAGGGVTTRHIPTTYVQPSKGKTPSSRGGMSNCTIGAEKSVKQERQYEKFRDGSLSVSSSSVGISSSPAKPPPKDMLPPRDKPSQAPRRNIDPNTRESHMNKEMEKAGCGLRYGYEDNGSVKVYDSSGTLILQGESIKFAAQTKDENGEETSRVMGRIQFPILQDHDGHSMHHPQVSTTSDTGISDPGNDGAFSPSNDGDSSSRFTFVSPIGSGDEMED